MKDIKDIINESLIKSYDYKLLIKKLEKKYNILNVKVYDSKSDIKSFYFEVNDEIEGQSFLALLDYYGYYCSEIKRFNNNLIYYIEPIFSENCNNLIYKKCNSKIYHITEKYNLKYIYDNGIKPYVGNTYRIFSERAYFICGETAESILKNVSHIISEKQFKAPIIIEIDVSKYNVNFYYDTSENKKYNCIYANAVFFPHLITKICTFDELKDYIKIYESKYFNTKYGKLYIK